MEQMLKHINPEDIKKLDPKIGFVINPTGQTVDVRETNIDERKEEDKKSKEPIWMQELKKRSKQRDEELQKEFGAK